MPEILETKNCVVAFLDLLGTSAAIMNDEHDSNLYSMNYILQTAFDMCSDKHLCKAEVKVKAFSDNIVFSMELPDDLTEPERLARVQNVLEICAYFQIAAFGRGIATRGGITIGTYFCNDIFVWGKALLRAYKMENTVAVYPRIVLDANLLELLPARDDKGNRQHVATDADGTVFLDYLSYFTMPSRNEYIKRSLDDIPYILKSVKPDERVLQKWEWIRNYLERGISNATGCNG